MSQIISLVINMQKRAIIVFFSICFAMGFLCVRLFTISCELSDASYIQSHYKKITLDKLSQMTGISSTHINDVENSLKEPGISIMVRIAYALKVDINDLYKIHW